MIAAVCCPLDHGRDVAHTVLMAVGGEAEGYEIKDEVKLRALGRRIRHRHCVEGQGEAG
jgi:hypothetical protein